MSDVNPVRLCVPADYTYARIVRMTAADLAVIAHMNVDEVEDIRMAAEEAFVWSCSTGPSEVQIDFSFEDGFLAQFSMGSSMVSLDEQSFEFTQLILDAVVDEYGVNDDRSVLSFRKRTVTSNA